MAEAVPRGGARRRLRLLVEAALVVAALSGALARVFLCDDAFISFRYAENLALGHGLVFNPGERVEGYTNFLWVLILAHFARDGADLATVARALGLGCFLATLLVVWRVSARLRAARAAAGQPGAGVPSLALALCATHPSLLAFATGGLEGSLFGLLLATLVALAERAWRAPGAAVLAAASVIGVLLALTRPDGALPFAVVGASLLVAAWRVPGPRRALAALGLPVLLGYLPYWLWRFQYYGFLFPNTYYAKNADRWQLAQGLQYLGAALASHPLYLLVPAAAAAALWPAARRRLLPGLQALQPRALLLTVAGACVAYAAHVVKAGGDFMEFRLLAPLVPAAALGLEVAAAAAPAPRLVAASIGALSALLFALHPTVLMDGLRQEPVEALAYHLDVQRWGDQGRALRERLPPGTVISTTAAGAISYYSRLAVVDELALTEPELAHRDIECPARATVGHCKLADEAYLRRRGVHLRVPPRREPLSFSATAPRRDDEVVLRLWDDEALVMRYLVRSPALDALFAASPDFKVRRR